MMELLEEIKELYRRIFARELCRSEDSENVAGFERIIKKINNETLGGRNMAERLAEKKLRYR